MKTIMKSTFVVASLLSLASACGDSKSAVDAKVVDAKVADAKPIDAPGIPAVPTLGAQVDRFGRPAINTALNHAFDGNAATAAAAKDAYNADKDTTHWATYVPEIAANLAILDGLDTVCGNQLLAGPTAVAGRYNGLAGALANDRLFVNTAATASTQYLAVEANATGVIPNADGGGRKLAFDVIDTSYSVMAIGNITGVGDGIAATAAKTNGTTFPYLAAPL